MKRGTIKRVYLIISCVLILLIGLLAGYSLGLIQVARRRFPDLHTVGEINPGIATIKFLEVKNGELLGELAGKEARLAYSPTGILELRENEAFKIPLAEIDLKTFYQTRDVPADALFVASRNGQYYYSVFDKRGFSLKPENRLYFQSAEEAEKRGYKRK